MTYALASGPTEEAVHEAASLLDQRIDVRPALSPVVVAKYLSWRDTPPRRRLFRQTRKALQEASPYAQKSHDRRQGGAQPRPDAPVARRPAEDRPGARRWSTTCWWSGGTGWPRSGATTPSSAPRPCATRPAQAHRDPASQALWPEVVYPLIELARWQRRFRSRPETLWDALVGRLFHVGDAGVELDRLLTRAVPAQVVAQIDDSVNLLARKPPAEEDEDDEEQAPADETDRLALHLGRLARHRRAGRRPGAQGEELVALAGSRPGPLPPGPAPRALEGGRQRPPGPGRPAGPAAAKPAGHRHIPLGPYRLVVVASIRGKAAGQIAIQGMANKQIEMTTPSFRTTGSANRPILAVWLYRDNSLVISHLDFQGTETLRPLARPAVPPAQVRRPRRPPPRAPDPGPGAPRPARRRPLPPLPAEEHGVGSQPVMVSHGWASTPGKRVRCRAFVVAIVRMSPGPPSNMTWAARMQSASRAWRCAVGIPVLRTKAQNSAARRIAGVVIGS